jgi:HEAT repeat protein
VNSRPALLLSAEDRTRVAEVHQLVLVGGEKSVEQLIARLDDRSWAVRREVVFALAQLGEAAIPAMIQTLVTRRDLEARIAALVEALAASRGNPDAALLALIESTDPAVVCDAAHILGRRQSPAALAALATLLDHGDDNVSVSAIEALGRIGGQQSVERLIRVLESGNFFRVFPAIDVVGRLGDVRATEPLVKLTGIELYTLEATRALGRIGDIGAIPALAALLVNPGDALVRTAATALWEIHKQRFAGTSNVAREGPTPWIPTQPEMSVRRLIQASNGADRGEQVAMCHVLGWFATREAIAALLGFLRMEGEVALAALGALGRLGDSINAEVLSSLRDGDSARRALLLPLVGRASARLEVVLCLRDPEPEVRAAACGALARLGDVGAVAPLFALLCDVSPHVSQAAVNAIVSLGSNETERLALIAAKSVNPQERRGGVRIVSTFGYRSGLAVLLAAIEDEDERLRDIALPGLALLDGAKALEALLTAATEGTMRTRTAAVRALGLASANPRVEEVLRASLQHADPWIRYHACHALGRRKDVASTDALVVLLDDEAGQVRIAAVEALSHMPGNIAKQVLRTAATSKDPDMQRAAVVGLGIRGDPDVLPTLLEATRSHEVATRLVALSALVGFKQPEAFDAMVRAASDPDESVRSAAMGLLATAPGPAATQALIGLVANRLSRSQALVALAHPAEGRVKALLEALEIADESLAGPLAIALSRIPRVEAGEGLLQSLGSKNVATRRAVASVLGSALSSRARSALADAAARDPDFEVRRLAAATLEN